MTKTDFITLLETYGAKPENWPSDKRAEGQAFIDTHTDIAAPLLADAARIDAMLDAASGDSPAPSDLLSARILKAARNTAQEQSPQQVERSWPFARMAAMMAVTFALGFMGGQFSPTLSPNAPSSIDTTLVAEAEDVTGWLDTSDFLGMDEVYSWVEETEI